MELTLDVHELDPPLILTEPVRCYMIGYDDNLAYVVVKEFNE